MQKLVCFINGVTLKGQVWKDGAWRSSGQHAVWVDGLLVERRRKVVRQLVPKTQVLERGLTELRKLRKEVI